jgi:hypothetical protein
MGVTLHVVPTRSSPRFAASSESLLRRLDVDIVHDMGAGAYFDVFQSHVGSWSQYREALLRRMSTSKALAKRVAARVLPSYWCKNRMMRRQFSKGQDARFVALSHAIADDYHHVRGISRDKIAVIPNGVDVAHFAPPQDLLRRREVRASLGADEHSLCC